MKDEDNAFGMKDLITIVPVAGIILAAMYDLGFFYSVDISLFSLFSVLAYSLGLIFGAYAIGNADGTGILRVSRQQSLFTASSQMNGRVFRSGERGVLFYDPATKKMSFLLWSEVKRLETAVPNGPSKL
jgi:hypothetical protein